MITRLPHDLMTGQPLRYRLTAKGKSFLLYSVGWNGRDDGGQVIHRGAGPLADLAQGDWVWGFPRR